METDEEEIDLCAEILDNWNSPTSISSEIERQNPFSHFNHEEEMHHQVIKSSENSTSIRSITDADTDMIPILVADTFYDKLLGHATDGIDIAALLQPPHPQTISSCSFKPCNNIPILTPTPSKTAKFSVWTPHDFARKLGVMLYSNKTTMDIDGFGEKMWRNPGADTTDFFNYGLNETRWKDYCKEMHALIHDPSPQPTQTSADTIEEGEIVEDDCFYESETKKQHIYTTSAEMKWYEGPKLVSSSRS